MEPTGSRVRVVLGGAVMILLAGCGDAAPFAAVAAASTPSAPAAISAAPTVVPTATAAAPTAASGTPSRSVTPARATPRPSTPAVSRTRTARPSPSPPPPCARTVPSTDLQREAVKRNPLVAAIYSGDLGRLTTALTFASPAQVNDTGGVPPLVEAVSVRCLPAVTALLDAGAAPDGYYTDGENRSATPLELAARLDLTEIAQLLLTRGATPDEWGEDGLTPAVAAAGAGAVRTLTALLEAGASTSARVPDPDASMTPLEAAVRADQPDAVDTLLEHGAQAEGSLFYPAIEARSLTMVQRLLDAGASPRPPVPPSPPFGYITATSPRDYARVKGLTAIAEALRAEE